MDTVASSSFAALLRRYRIAAGLTQEGLAERANLSVRAVSDLERGLRTAPRKDTIDLLAAGLDLVPADRAALHASVSRRRPPPVQAGVLSLPAEPTPLIGREYDEARAVHLLRWQGVRLLTLTGPGGVGKTRLALRVGHSLAGDFDDGVTFVPLASVGDPDLVPATLAGALGIGETGGRPIEEVIVSYLQDKGRLAVLDNLEHLLPAAPFLARLLAACPRLVLLVTSRARLHLQVEQEMEVPPLAAPAPSSLPSPAYAARSPAVTLFVQRARAVRPEFQLSDENALTVAEICWRLDGLPLAIELAAARIKLFPPRALLERLTEPLAVLTDGAADQPSRLQTLRNTVDWSYSLLSPQEQILFARLSIFVGGCTFEAVERVCNSEGELELLDGLASLVDKSLLRQDGKEEARFEMLETIRQFAAEKLAQRGERDLLQQRHAEFFAGFVAEAEAYLEGPEQGRWIGWLEREHDNLRAALRWSVGQGSELGLQIAVNLGVFWDVRGYISEGLRWLEAALTIPAREEDAYFRAWASSGAGNLAHRLGDFRRAEELHEHALQLRREAGNSSGVAGSLFNLARVARIQDRNERAQELFEESLGLYRQLGDTRGTAMVLNSLGLLMQRRGDADRARALYDECLELFREVGDARGVVIAVINSADLAEQQGDVERAEALYTESLRLGRGRRERMIIAESLIGLGAIAGRRGHHERAVQLLGAADTIVTGIGVSLEPMDQERVQRASRLSGTALTDAVRDAAWRRGAAMSMEEAIEYALDEHEDG